jgi:hypothetical protein
MVFSVNCWIPYYTIKTEENTFRWLTTPPKSLSSFPLECSPGVFVDEIDQSQLPATPTEVGPVVIGRARKGPANKPVKIESFSDFVQTFGNPVAGNEGGDVWRSGNNTAPTYAAR